MEALSLLWLVPVGAATGFAAGLLGIGGGMLLVPFLSMLLPLQGVPATHVVKVAIATSLTTILFTSLSSVRGHHRRGAVRWDAVRRLAPGIVAGSAAGAQMLLAGGNAIDAAVASLFALTVAEPMMVGILGGGLSHIRLADGRHVVIDNLSTAPGQATADMYECLSDEIGKQRDTRDRENVVGAKAVAVPGALKGWCEALARFGTLPLAEV
ncbi:MAG TPA: TSUP family transporter, partial [Quisquiliibacterium sp.]|nr:TSUP family transporter [Quisquiliibacterium sp.]